MKPDEAEERAQAYKVLREYEKPYKFGRFTGALLPELEDEKLTVKATEAAAFCYRWRQREREVRDFTGEVRARIHVGDCEVTRVGMCGDKVLTWARRIDPWLTQLESSMLTRLWVWIWQEDIWAQQLLMDRGYRCAALQISAASDYRSLWVKGTAGVVPLPLADKPGLVRLNLPTLRISNVLIDKLMWQIERLDMPWAEHYSQYNKRRSWSALSIRGFGGGIQEIEKPAEMPNSWKEDNPGALAWTCEDTRLRHRLPAIEPILEQLGGAPFQRIRLMKLSKGNGELSRHADITDKEAGTADGKIMRLHVPIVTNPGVRFTSWSFDGVEQETHFEAGEAFYLDTRKAHKAVNLGESDRIHLVVDCVSNAERRCLISQTECL